MYIMFCLAIKARKMQRLLQSFAATAKYSKPTIAEPALIFSNPCLHLQQYLDIPLIGEADSIFVPDIESMQMSLDLFIPKTNHVIRKVTGTIHSQNFPEQRIPEVTFIGRSNVGKSSLLKAILQHIPKVDHLVKTSKRPGHTLSANFYNIGENLCIVDMPGYGENQPQYFDELITNYLKNRRNLVRTFLLIDGKDGLLPGDEYAFEMLEKFHVPYSLVITKIDKAIDAVLLKNLLYVQQIRDQYASITCFPQVFMVSAHTLQGMGYFLAFIAHITGNLPAPSPNSGKSS